MGSTSKKIMLKSSDGETFEVEEAVALELKTIKNCMEDVCADKLIFVYDVSGKILSKVIEYCKKHVDAAAHKGQNLDDELKAWDADFVKVEPNVLCELIMAASDLDIKSLLDLTSQTAADTMIKGKRPEEIRETFNIKNDFTPEEEEELWKEIKWALHK